MPQNKQIAIPTEDAMDKFGEALALQLKPGDTILLTGVIGAGKTHLCRAIIRSIVGKSEEVPSPTYTIVQTYQGPKAEIWHADLYRLSDSSELVELGLDEAMETAIVLIEWPDRLHKSMRPTDALEITIMPKGEGRIVDLSSGATRWKPFLSAFADA